MSWWGRYSCSGGWEHSHWGTPSLPGGPRCILLLQFKLQIHLKYRSQECSQLKCKPCWVWKIFKKSWTLHLGGLHFHALKKGRERVPTHHHHHHHHLHNGQTPARNDIYSKRMSHISPNIFHKCVQRSETWACSCFLVKLIREKEQLPHLWLFKAPWYKYQPSVRPSAFGCYIMHQGQATKHRQVASHGTVYTTCETTNLSLNRCYQQWILCSAVIRSHISEVIF